MARRLRQPVRVARVERDAEERTGHAPLPVILAEDRHGRLGLELPDCQVLATTPASQLDPARGARVLDPASIPVWRDEPAPVPPADDRDRRRPELAGRS